VHDKGDPLNKLSKALGVASVAFAVLAATATPAASEDYDNRQEPLTTVVTPADSNSQGWLRSTAQRDWDRDETRTWSRGTFDMYVMVPGRDAYRWKLQTDGNLVTYKERGDGTVIKTVNHTGTHGRNTRLVGQGSDCNLVLYEGNTALWNYRAPARTAGGACFIQLYTDQTDQALRTQGTHASNLRTVWAEKG